MSGASSKKGAQFLAQRIGQDALTIAELIAQGEAKDTRIAELEAVLTTRQRERLKARESMSSDERRAAAASVAGSKGGR